MAALAANSATQQIIFDNDKLVVARLFLHQDTAGDESSVLKVNAETLSARTFKLTIDPGAVAFQPGEVVTGSVSAAVATVMKTVDGNTLSVVGISGNTAFAVGDVLTGSITSPVHTANVTAVTIPARVLTLESIAWAVHGAANATVAAKIAIEYANSSAFVSALSLSGQGYMGRNELAGVAITPPATLTNPNGNIYISTYGIPIKGGYTVVVSLSKEAGYAQKPGY